MKQKFSSTLIVSVLVVGFVVMFLSSALKGLYQVYFVDLASHFGEGAQPWPPQDRCSS